MKALVLTAPSNFEYVDYPDPEIRNPDDVLIRIRAAAICGSDVHGMDGSTGRRKPPVIMGHEAAGEIVAVGSGVSSFKPGDRVTFDSTEYCGECEFCRRGEVNLCSNRKVLGVSCDEYRRDGAFAEFLVVPQRILYHIPKSLDFIGAALAEPSAVAAHAAAITPLKMGDTLAVVGSGLIGLLLIQILRAFSPALIVAFDTDKERLRAAQKAGATAGFDPSNPDELEAALRLTNKRGFDRVFEAVGATAPIQTALSAVRKGGSITLIGNVSPLIQLPLQSVVTRQISLLGSCATAGEYPLVLDLLASGKIDYASVISATAPLSEGATWFKRLYNREKGLLKVVLEP